MLLRRAGLMLLLPLGLSGSLLACAPPAPPVAEGQGAETPAALERLQLTTMQLQAGQQTVESFVLRADGQVHWAQWNSNGSLLAAAQGQDPMAFAELQQHPLWQSGAEASPSDDLLGRPAFYAELARIRPQGTELRSLEALDLSLSGLSARLMSVLQPLSLTPGLYLWLTPQPPDPALQPDLNLNQPPPEAQTVVSALQQALRQGHAVVPVPDSAYFQGERALRQAFFAQHAGTSLQFGLLSVPDPASGR